MFLFYVALLSPFVLSKLQSFCLKLLVSTSTNSTRVKKNKEINHSSWTSETLAFAARTEHLAAFLAAPKHTPP